jgi:UDP-glucose 4-epimerase
VANFWTDARVLITGGTGFLGRYLTRRLVNAGARVTLGLRDGAGPENRAPVPEEVILRDGDVRNYGQIYRLVAQSDPQYIFHLAAVGVTDPFVAEESALRVNVHGTLNLLRATRQAGQHQGCRVIMAGTSYEYGEEGEIDPGNVYAASKVAAWAFCRMYYRAHGLPVIVARPFNVYGPGQDPRALIPSAIRAALEGQDFPTTPGEQLRDFVYVDDVIAGLLAIATVDGIDGHSLDLGTGRATAVREVVERVFALVNGQGFPRIGALPYRPGTIWKQVADARRTAAMTGWRAKAELERGLRSTIEAMRCDQDPERHATAKDPSAAQRP